MENRKSSRKSKWLGKILHREGSVTPVSAASSLQSQQKASSTREKVHDVIPTEPKLEPKLVLKEPRSHVEQPSVTEAQKSRQRVEQPTPIQNDVTPESDASNERIELSRPRDGPHLPISTAGASKASNAGTLTAPLTARNDDGKGKSPNFKDSDQKKIPLLLNTDASIKNAGLWEKAYIQSSEDGKTKALFEQYEAVLEDSSLESFRGATFPRQMAALVQSRIEIMKKKQWMLQWDQKSIVVRDQAARIVKFVQTFQSLGNAIAQIDPVHAGIPWAGVCAILNVSNLLMLICYLS